MIKSGVFHASFHRGFAPALRTLPGRRTGRTSAYEIETAVGPLALAFHVNPKASAIPYCAGECWPLLHAPAPLRRAEGDDGLVSWYQYTTEPEHAAIQALQRRVYAKVAAQDGFAVDVHRQMRDNSLPLLRATTEAPLEARFPHTALAYLDADDAEAWGTLLGAQLPGWLARFQAQPETLESYMWRVHWTAEVGRRHG
ncbi:MAG TPA: hypothetical protein VFS40_09280 [Gemmatimonadales bacterium]|nr:hypothetical protein [Gemmatimonadales bacterium]